MKTLSVEAGKFTSFASGRLGRSSNSPPQFGQTPDTIANLEAQLGVTLFERVGHYPQLTAQGKSLLDDARDVITSAEALKAKARNLSAGLEPGLSVVIDVMFPRPCFTDALGSFKEQFPSTPLTLHVEALGRVAQLVLDGECSLGVTGTLPYLPPGLAAGRLFSEEVVTVVAPASTLASVPGPVALRDLQEATQLVLTDRSLLTSGVDYGVQGRNIWRLVDLGAKRALLRAGLGWGAHAALAGRAGPGNGPTDTHGA